MRERTDREKYRGQNARFGRRQPAIDCPRRCEMSLFSFMKDVGEKLFTVKQASAVW